MDTTLGKMKIKQYRIKTTTMNWEQNNSNPKAKNSPWPSSSTETSKGVQFSSVAQLYMTLCDPMDCHMSGFLSITNSRSLLKLMSIELVMPSSHLILCHPFSSYLQSFPASGSFQMSQFFTSGGQSIGVSASVYQSFQWIFRTDFL